MILPNSGEWKGIDGPLSIFRSTPVNMELLIVLAIEELLDDVRSGKSLFHAIEVMAYTEEDVGGE